MNIQTEVKAFLTWCERWHNSPDIINLRWFDENRRQTFYTPDEEQQVMVEVVRLTRPPSLIEQAEMKTESLDHGENDQMANKPHKRNSKGRPAADRLLKTLNLDTMQGKIIEYILKGNQHIDNVLDNFMIERHAFLTTLNVIARSTGIGYTVQNDNIILTLPHGVVDPFEL